MRNQKELFENLNQDNTLTEIQEYIGNVFNLRGFFDERVEDKLLHLSEEVGELIKAVRKYSPDSYIDPTHAVGYSNVEEELADVLIVLLSVANKLDMNLFECLKDKEAVNITRKWVKNLDHDSKQ